MLHRYFFNKMLALILCGIGLPALVSAQSYEEVYSQSSDEVRSVMDLNKMDGKPILTNIYVNYEFSFNGLNENGNRDRLPSILSNTLEAFNISINPTNDHVVFTCLITNGIEKLKAPLIEHGMSFNNLFKKEYTIIKH